MVQGSAIAPGGARAFAVLLVMVAFSGCGHSGRSANGHRRAAGAAPVCQPAAREVIARAAAVGPASVGAVAGTGNDAQPECRLSGRSSGGGRVAVVANLDSSPQPFARLERAIVEAGQQFGQTRGFTPPQSVGGVGLDAGWLPDQAKLLTTDGTRLITVVVGGSGVPARQRRALAEAVARSYLGPLQRKAAAQTEA